MTGPINHSREASSIFLPPNQTREKVVTSLSDALKFSEDNNGAQFHNLNLSCAPPLYDMGAAELSRSLNTNAAFAALKSLILHNAGLTAAAIYSLSPILRTKTSITCLVLSYNQIGDLGACFLATTLKVSRHITFLDIRKCGITCVGITNSGGLAEACAGLNSLFLCDNNIGDSGSSALATALNTNKSIAFILLSNTGMGDAGAAKWAEFVSRRVDNEPGRVAPLHLDMSKNQNIGDRGISAILNTQTKVNSKDPLKNIQWIFDRPNKKQKIDETRQALTASSLNEIVKIMIKIRTTSSNSETSLFTNSKEFKDELNRLEGLLQGNNYENRPRNFVLMKEPDNQRSPCPQYLRELITYLQNRQKEPKVRADEQNNRLKKIEEQAKLMLSMFDHPKTVEQDFTINYPNGNTYIGEALGNTMDGYKAHGEGVIVNCNGEIIFSGHFSYGQYHGEGTLLENGRYCAGRFRNGVRVINPN